MPKKKTAKKVAKKKVVKKVPRGHVRLGNGKIVKGKRLCDRFILVKKGDRPFCPCEYQEKKCEELIEKRQGGE